MLAYQRSNQQPNLPIDFDDPCWMVVWYAHQFIVGIQLHEPFLFAESLFQLTLEDFAGGGDG